MVVNSSSWDTHPIHQGQIVMHRMSRHEIGPRVAATKGMETGDAGEG